MSWFLLFLLQNCRGFDMNSVRRNYGDDNRHRNRQFGLALLLLVFDRSLGLTGFSTGLYHSLGNRSTVRHIAAVIILAIKAEAVLFPIANPTSDYDRKAPHARWIIGQLEP